MKKFAVIIVIFLLTGGFSCFAQDSGSPAMASGDVTKVTWETNEHDFGIIEQGTPVSYDFTFTNSGSEPLIITNVKASCGCTATNYPKDPIQPGELASITATYNAKAKGIFNKSITVYTNSDESVKMLRIKGTVQ